MLGKTVAELENELTPTEFAEWIAHIRLSNEERAREAKKAQQQARTLHSKKNKPMRRSRRLMK